jgi:hypothetical protein
MKKFLVCLLVAFTSVAAYAVFENLEHFAAGIKIGPDSTGSERLAIYDFDEYATGDCVVIGTLAAGAQATLVIEGVPTIRVESTVLARPMNPASQTNMDKLLIKHVYVSQTKFIFI